VPFVLSSEQGKAGFAAQVKDAEKEMIDIAKGLPVADWVDGICGFGPKGLAMKWCRYPSITSSPTNMSTCRAGSISMP
jgi:hypothetical protein